jgi:hypothetical protein
MALLGQRLEPAGVQFVCVHDQGVPACASHNAIVSE